MTFNLDVWLSSEHGVRAVEAMAQELYGPEYLLSSESADWEQRCFDTLRVLLSPPEVVCPECGGRKRVDLPSPTERIGGHMVMKTIAVSGPCPTCHGKGHVAGESLLLVREELERVAVVADDGSLIDVRDPQPLYVDDDVAYRLIPREEP